MTLPQIPLTLEPVVHVQIKSVDTNMVMGIKIVPTSDLGHAHHMCHQAASKTPQPTLSQDIDDTHAMRTSSYN